MQRSSGQIHKSELGFACRSQTGSTGLPVHRLSWPGCGPVFCVLFVLLSIAWYQAYQESEKSAAKARTREVAVLRGSAASIRGLAFSPDGTVLAALGRDQSIAVWEVKSRRIMSNVRTEQHPAYCIAYSADGLMLATGNHDGTITFWDTDTWRESRVLAVNPWDVRCLAFSPAGRVLASGCDDGEIALLDRGSGQVRTRFLGHQRSVNSLAFSHDGSLLASAGIDGAVRLWEPDSGHLLTELSGHRGSVAAVAFSADGKTLASARTARGEVKVWDVARTRERLSLNTPDLIATSLAFSSDNRTLVAGYGLITATGVGRGTIILWDLTTGSERTRLKGHANWVSCLGLAADGSLLASGGMDGSVRLWDLAPESSGR